ncbi:MAG: hypothetical protein K0V04_26990 [Deltaproteobacteria bacterium]|nr:hypothetical protein [Deltaproteobacteria bacterium]
MKKFALSSIIAATLCLSATEAQAAWLACCTNGIAYSSSSLSGPWTPAGGCAGGPWMIEHAMAPTPDGSSGTGIIVGAQHGLSEQVTEQIDLEYIPELEDPTVRSFGGWVDYIIKGLLGSFSDEHHG